MRQVNIKWITSVESDHVNPNEYVAVWFVFMLEMRLRRNFCYADIDFLKLLLESGKCVETNQHFKLIGKKTARELRNEGVSKV